MPKTVRSPRKSKDLFPDAVRTEERVVTSKPIVRTKERVVTSRPVMARVRPQPPGVGRINGAQKQVIVPAKTMASQPSAKMIEKMKLPQHAYSGQRKVARKTWADPVVEHDSPDMGPRVG